MRRTREGAGALDPGARLGHYQIAGPLGAGGSGSVYRARDTRLGRDVALKVLEGGDAVRRRRIVREARVAGALNHPNLVTVFDFGFARGVHYLVFELLSGQTLRDRLAAGRLHAREALRIASEIARGLAAAHAKGVIHRDLKPENIFLVEGGYVKILDFGLARSDAASATSLEDALTGASTEEGAVVGTVGYMSPEQVRGAELDHRSDFFSFGAVAYEMLGGRKAFQAETKPEVQTAILREEARPLWELEPSIGREVNSVVQRCLAKRPEQRFQSTSDLAFALDELVGAAAREGSGSRPARLAAPAAALIALAAFSYAMLAAPRDREPRAWGFYGDLWQSGLPASAAEEESAAKQQLENALYGADIWKVPARPGAAAHAEPVRLIASTDRDAGPQFSPDGRRIVIARKQREAQEIWLCDADGSGCAQLTHGGTHSGTPRWSPDGRRVVFDSRDSVEADLYWIDVETRSIGRVTEHSSDDVVPSWSRDGGWIYFGSDRSGSWQVWRVRPDGSGSQQVTRRGGFVAFESPDGRWIYYTKRDQPGIWRAPARGGEEQIVQRDLAPLHWGYWAVAADGLYFLDAEAARGQGAIVHHDFLTGMHRRIATLEAGPVAGEPGIAVSPDGRWLAYAQLAAGHFARGLAPELSCSGSAGRPCGLAAAAFPDLGGLLGLAQGLARPEPARR